MHTGAMPAHAAVGVRLVALAGLLLIIYVTLYPFHFDGLSRILHLHLYFKGFTFGGYSRCCTRLAILEPLANVALFLPFGLGLTGMVRKRVATWRAAFAVVLLLCVGLSLSIEVLQVFQPWRSPTLADVLMNSIGGGLGFLCYWSWGKVLRNGLAR